jgi:hypothetical protein
MNPAEQRHCLNCDKPATEFCLAHHDIGGPEKVTPKTLRQNRWKEDEFLTAGVRAAHEDDRQRAQAEERTRFVNLPTCKLCGLQHRENDCHVLPPIQAFTRRLRNEPLTLTFDIQHPGELAAGLRAYSDRVTVTVDSGDPGGDPVEPYGPSEFESYIYKAISEWFDGAAVGLRPANLPKNAYPVARKGQIEYVTIPED